jgi:signal transduction histidine kinase
MPDVTPRALDRVQAEIAEQLLHRLGERVKELRLLHTVTRLAQSDRQFNRGFFTAIASLVPGAWQHTDVCAARITFGDFDERTEGWCDSPWRQSASFVTSGGTGIVEVIYTAERPEAAEGPFLAEERDALNSLAEILGAFVERHFTEIRTRSLEQQLRHAQKMEALGSMAGGIAHDFNNILLAIGGNAYLARHEIPSSHPASGLLDEVLRAHARATDLVGRILTFSRRRDVHKQPIHMTAVVNDAIQLLRVSLPKTISIRTCYDIDLPVVLADETMVVQVIMNLGTNASHAMGTEGGELGISLRAVTFAGGTEPPVVNLSRGRYVRMDISDTGTGIAPEHLERLFEPFFTTKGEGGTGLGLSVVHGIVHEHSGAIVVESTVGQGSTFTVYLPATG